MRRRHLLAPVSAVMLFACSEHSATGPISPANTFPQAPSVAVMTGVIVVSGSDEAGAIFLKESSGALTMLIGTETDRLASVDGAEVEVRGTWDAPPGLVVESFTVLAVDGRPAIDGVLVYAADQYALQLADGSLYELADPPEALTSHIGERLWVTGGAAEDEPIQFGVIAQR